MRGLAGALLLTLLGVAGVAKASPIVFHAELNGINTEFGGEALVWPGGSVVGNIIVADSPYAININGSTGEATSRFSFTGTASLDGVALDFLSSSYVAVSHTPSPGEADSIIFNFNFDPINVTPNLQLLNLFMQSQFVNTLPYSAFPNVNGLVPQQKGLHFNLLRVPQGDVTFGLSGSYEVSAVPEPSTVALIAVALLCMFGLGVMSRHASGSGVSM